MLIYRWYLPYKKYTFNILDLQIIFKIWFCANQCSGSGSGWIRIQITRLDPDPYSESRK